MGEHSLNMSRWNPLRKLPSVDRKISVQFIENAMDGIPRPNTVEPNLEYVSEVDLFVPPERKIDIAEYEPAPAMNVRNCRLICG